MQAIGDSRIRREDLTTAIGTDENHRRLGSDPADHLRDGEAVGRARAQLVGENSVARAENVVVHGKHDAAAVGAHGARQGGLLEPGAAKAAADRRTAHIDGAPGGAEVRAGLACRLGERRLVRPRLEAEDHAAGVAFSAAAPAAWPTLWCRGYGRVSAGR